MGTSFVTLDRGDKGDAVGFWMRDYVLELWLRLLALHIPEPNDSHPPSVHESSRKIRDHWLLASKGWFNGCVPHSLEDVASTEEGKAIIRSTIDSLMEVLQAAPPVLDGRVLALIGIEQFSQEPFETRRLLEVGNAFRDLLDGKLTCTVKSTDFMPDSVSFGIRGEDSQPKPYKSWHSHPIAREEDAANAFGYHLILHCRDEAIATVPANASEETRVAVAQAVDGALHNVCAMLEGFWFLDVDEDHRIELELTVQVCDKSGEVQEELSISPCKLDLPIGYWKWSQERDFQ